MATLAEMLGPMKGAYPRAAGMFEWMAYEPSTDADAYPERRPVGVVVPDTADYSLELIAENGTTSNVTVTLVAGAIYEIANLARVRSGAAEVILLFLKN